MSTEQARRLLGGYATGTLTPEETRALFEAALEDQDLFNELNHEQVLREMFEDGPSRRDVLAALSRADALAAPMRRWHGYRWALGAAASAIAMVTALWVFPWHTTRHQTAAVASLQAPAAALPAPEAAAPAPPVPPAQAPPRAHKRVMKAEPRRQIIAAAQPQPVPAGTVSQAVEVQAPAPPAVRPMNLAQATAGGHAFRPAGSPQLAWTILKQDENGEFADMPSSTVFHDGDRIRIRVRPATNGSIALLDTTSGQTTASAIGSVAGGEYVLPGTGTIAVRAGMSLALRFTPTVPEADLKMAAGANQSVMRKSAAAHTISAVTIPIHINVE